jgi:hypothetical protein
MKATVYDLDDDLIAKALSEPDIDTFEELLKANPEGCFSLSANFDCIKKYGNQFKKEGEI